MRPKNAGRSSMSAASQLALKAVKRARALSQNAIDVARAEHTADTVA
jgi:hypothetical protein